ncbi:hypothetical protein [Pontiella desulfatans]|nr:hypothetical protein [Pontiella desulfatans]
MAVMVFAALVVSASGRDGLGISSWCGWRPGQVSKADCPELRSVPLVLGWNKLEPEPGHYEFDRHIGEPLRAAMEDDLFVTMMVWVRPGTPHWLFDEMGVPRVYTDRDVDPLGKKMSKENNLHPYYLNPAYQDRFFKLIDAFGAYVNGLPNELRERVVFIQSAEGSTGDGQPYKGKPIEAEYVISKPDWNDFRRETWMRYQKAFKGIPILVNSDANTAEENDWMFQNMDVIALKHGMFSHGYHVSDNVGRLEKFDAITKSAGKQGIPLLTRGEMDGEMHVYGWSTRNIPQALYWSGVFATHCRLDIWNIPHQALEDEANWPAYAFFNRYAGLTDPSSSPRAFCALRDGLDASDFERFPVSAFGGREGRKNDVDRYLKIAAAFEQYGARMDDPNKAVGHGMVNRKRMGYNDVGWGIMPGNYSRFLTQVAPGSGDVGLWSVDDSVYGRFARSFEQKSGKKQLRFRLDEHFSAEKVEVRVVYLDRGRGQWSLGIAGKSGTKRMQNADSGEWKTMTVSLPRKLLRNAELLLSHEGGDDTIFHMVEVEKYDR